MAGKTRPEAVENFVTPLQRVVSCVTDRVLQASRYDLPERPRALLFGGQSLPRIRGRNDLELEVAQYFDVRRGEGDAGPWRCHTLSYAYVFRVHDGPSVLAFHWHPTVARVPFPHLHARAHVEPVDLSRAHIPSGRISLEAVIRFAIEDFGVEPRRSDWNEVLLEVEERFDRYRTW